MFSSENTELISESILAKMNKEIAVNKNTEFKIQQQFEDNIDTNRISQDIEDYASRYGLTTYVKVSDNSINIFCSSEIDI